MQSKDCQREREKQTDRQRLTERQADRVKESHIHGRETDRQTQGWGESEREDTLEVQ